MRAILGVLCEEGEAWRVVRQELLAANNGTELALQVEFKLRRDRRDAITKRGVGVVVRSGKNAMSVFRRIKINLRPRKSGVAAQPFDRQRPHSITTVAGVRLDWAFVPAA
jgi:hypothetical protein